MPQLILLLGLLLSSALVLAQPAAPPANVEIGMSRDSARQFFGTYEFEPRFQMQIFSENNAFFAQRLGDPERFQIFPKRANVFFLKAMPAELEFQRAATGQYETLILHQGGHARTARRIKAQPQELYDTVRHLDSVLYQAYNRRDLSAFMAFLAPSVEFYHDQTGVSKYQENLARFKTNFTKATRMRRELVPGSLEIYPVKDFGAIETGTHRFYQTDPGQPEKLVSEPKFVHVWQQTRGQWQLVRIVSYGH